MVFMQVFRQKKLENAPDGAKELLSCRVEVIKSIRQKFSILQEYE